jgi:hypothetical protein
MADLLDSIRTQIDARISELRPIVEEAAGLEAALAALDGSTTPTRATRPARATRRRQRDRPPRRGQTRELVIAHVRAHPGSTAGDVATALGLNRNSVATRLAHLAKSGELTKAARGYAAP